MFYIYPITSVKMCCGEHVQKLYRDIGVPCQGLSIKSKFSVALNVGLGGVSDVVSAIIPHEQSQ